MIQRWEANIIYHQMGYMAGNTIFSENEIKRRHTLVKNGLKKINADVLIAQLCFPSAAMAVDPSITWLTGTPGYKSAVTAILPADGSLKLFHGSSPQSLNGADSPYLANQGKSIKEALKGVKKIAYCGLGRIELKFYQYIMDCCPDAEIVDFSRELDKMKAVKSKEELEAIENAVWIQDKLIEAAPSYIRPGRTQMEIQADIVRLLYEFNADMSVMSKLLITSGKNGHVGTFPTIGATTREHLCFPEYRLQKDDWVHIIYETPGIGGYYSETGRIFYFEEPCSDAKEIWNETRALLDFEADLIKPGRTLKEIHDECGIYLKERGAEPDNNIF